MKINIARKWTAALRSGKYSQGEGCLNSGRDDNNKPIMCCLAVLCDIHAKEHKKRWKTDKEGTKSYLGKAYYLPLEVARWAGMKLPKSKKRLEELKESGLDPRIGKTYASKRNDWLNQSFDYIAKAIDKCAANI